MNVMFSEYFARGKVKLFGLLPWDAKKRNGKLFFYGVIIYTCGCLLKIDGLHVILLLIIINGLLYSISTLTVDALLFSMNVLRTIWVLKFLRQNLQKENIKDTFSFNTLFRRAWCLVGFKGTFLGVYYGFSLKLLLTKCHIYH